MPRSRKERFGFNPWLNRERLRGTKQHKPLLAFRRPTLERIAENHDALIQETPMDIFAEQEEYIIRLSPLAYPLTQLFAEREILAEQYTNWENAHIGGVVSPGDNDTVADTEMQEIAFELMNLVKLVRMDIGGGCVLDDGTVYPTALELITVGMAHSRGLVGIDPLAPDDWIFIIVHVLPSEALTDTNYGKDKATLNNSGQIVVQDGKVRYTHPAPAIKFVIDGTDYTTALSTQTLVTDTEGDYPLTTIAFNTQPTAPRPITGGGTFTDIPQNCCNQGGQPSTPPDVIPPTMPPDGTPSPPTPQPNIDVNLTCTGIQSAGGVGFDFFSEALSFSAKSFDVEAGLGTAIHTWISTNVPAFDFNCDQLNSITFQLLATWVESKIFGIINNPFPFGSGISPRILNVHDLGASGKSIGMVYAFPVDREAHQFLGPVDIYVNDYAQAIHDLEHKVSIDPAWRYDNHVGFEDFAFIMHEADIVTAASADPEVLAVCGINYKPHQYLFHFNFASSNDYRVIGSTLWLYDDYGNARINCGSTVLPGYVTIDTDGVHGFDFTVDLICPLRDDGSVATVYGVLEAGTPVHGWDSNYFGVAVNTSDGTEYTSEPNVRPLIHNMGADSFTFNMPHSYTAGTQYNIGIKSGSFPDVHFKLLSLSGYLG